MEKLTYDKYKSYGGKLPESAFNKELVIAEKKINYYTFNRLNDLELTEEQKNSLYFCEFELININQINKENYKSASSDGVSVSYADMSTKEENERGTVMLFLSDIEDDGGKITRAY